MKKGYFAYGSNMCIRRLQEYIKTSLPRGIRARLADYRIVFNKKSSDGSGKANINEHSGDEVWGVLYSVSEDQFQMIKDSEKGYAPSEVLVQRDDKSKVIAWTFIAIKPEVSSRPPYSWYKRFIVMGAKEHELPVKYISSLEDVKSVEDPDCKRDLKNRIIACSC